MRCLIVGGEHDGEWHEVDPKVPHLRVAVRIPLTAAMAFDLTPISESVMTIATYQRREWRAGADEGEWFLYTPPEDSPATTFERLLRNYRPRRA